MISLKGEKVALRALEPEDIEVLMRWENDPANWNVTGTLTPYNRNVLKRYLDNAHQSIFEAGQLRLIIESTENGAALGTLDLFDFDPHNQRAGVGILIGEAQNRGKGFAAEALDILIGYAFRHLGLQQLYANILEDNPASRKLFESKGFVETGRKKRWVKQGSKFWDELFYQLLK